MTGPSSRFESLIDQQIRQAQEHGEFDDLPGKGRPLPGWGGQDDDSWWLRDFVRREQINADALLPTSLRLARERERLPEEVAGLPSAQRVRDLAADLNRRIAEYHRAPSDPYLPLGPVDPEALVAQWRASLSAPATDPQSPPAGGGAVTAPRAKRRRWLPRRASAQQHGR